MHDIVEKNKVNKGCKQLWIVNTIAMDESPEIVKELKKRRDIKG